MHVQIGNLRLRYRHQPLLLSFPPEVFWDQSLDHVVLKAIAKALLDDGSRHMSRPKPRQPRTLLIALNLRLGLARNLRRRNLHRDLALDVLIIGAVGFFRVGLFCVELFRVGLGRVGSFCGAHIPPFTTRTSEGAVEQTETGEFIGRALECKDRRRAASNGGNDLRDPLTRRWPTLLNWLARATQWVPRPSRTLRRAGTTNACSSAAYAARSRNEIFPHPSSILTGPVPPRR